MNDKRDIMPADAVQRIRKTRESKRRRGRERAIRYTDDVLSAVANSRIAHEMNIVPHQGQITFKYRGRRVQYFITTFKLIVRSANGMTVYDDYTPEQVIKDLASNQDNAFNHRGDIQW